MALTQHAQAFRTGLLKTIRDAFPKSVVPMIGSYDGKVDPKAIASRTINTPAIMLTILGGTSRVREGTVYDDLAIGLYIVTKDQMATKRSDMALRIRESLARLLPYADVEFGDSRHKFGGMGKKAALEIEWQNRFDGVLDEMGLTLWVGAWLHTIELPALANYDDLDDFETAWIEIFNPGEVEPTGETGNSLTDEEITLETLP